MTEEIWKDISGYEGLYKINQSGDVLNCKTNKIMAVSTNNSGGYKRIKLTGNGKRLAFSIHRLIAQAFISNPDGKPCIDHINTVRTDNRIENLHWVTYSENLMNPLTRENLKRDFPQNIEQKYLKL